MSENPKNVVAMHLAGEQESDFGRKLDALLVGQPLREIFIHCLASAVTAAHSLGGNPDEVAMLVRKAWNGIDQGAKG